MADEIDLANELAEKQLSALINEAKNSEVDMFSNSRGTCLWCEEPVHDGRRWCSQECAKEWEMHHR